MRCESARICTSACAMDQSDSSWSLGRCRDVVRVSDVEIFTLRSACSCIGKVWKTFGTLSCCNLYVVPAWSRGYDTDHCLHTQEFYYCCCVRLHLDYLQCVSRLVFHLKENGSHVHKCFVGRLCFLSTGFPLFAQTSDPKIRACRVISLVSFQRSSCVTRLLSDPRHVAGSLDAKVSMPDVDTERLQKFFDHFNTKIAPPFLQTGYERGWHLEALDNVMDSPSHPCAVLRCQKLACAVQRATLARRLGAGER